jgi:hypothetical protein
MHRLALVVAVAACGRLHFDADPGTPGDDARGTDAAGMLHEAYLKASNTDFFDQFGIEVAISGDGSTLAVGAVDESSAAVGIDGDQTDNTALDSGAVYVFVRAGATWVQQAYVKASNTDPADSFGAALALSGDGNTLAVGAPLEDGAATGIDGNQGDNSAANAGAVYVFARAGTTWSQQAYVKASNTEGNDELGSSVALSADGNTLATGAIDESSAATGIGGNQADDSAANAGAAYVFTRVGVKWSQQAYVKASNTDAGDGFGFAVALAEDGNTLAVSAPAEASASTGIDGDQSDNSQPHAGAVYVFARVGMQWAQQAYAKGTPAIAGDFFGQAVACSGDTVAAGAPGNDTVPNAGAVFVFARGGTSWSPQAMLVAPNARNNDQLGAALALSGDTLVAGAPYEPSGSPGLDGDETDASAPDAGAAYWFARAGTSWTFAHYVKATNPGSGDNFAGNLAIAADGTIAAGASREDGSATGVDGTPDEAAMDSGAAYALDRD